MRFILTLLLLTQTALAAPKIFDLAISIKVDGSAVSSPRLILEEGKKGVVFQHHKDENYFIEVIAHDGQVDAEKGVMLDFLTGVMEKAGNRKILARGKMLAHDEAVTLLAPQLKNTEDFEITIQARQK